MAEVELMTAMGSLTQAIQGLTQNMSRGQSYAYAPFTQGQPNGGVPGVGAQIGSSLGGPAGGSIGSLLGMFGQQFLPPGLAERIGTSPYQNSYYREQSADVTRQLFGERSNQMENLAKSTGISQGLLGTGSMVLDMISPGTFDKVASTLDPSYLSGQAQFAAVQATRFAALKFGGAVADYAKEFATAPFHGLTASDSQTALMMSVQGGGGGGGPAGIVQNARALGGVMSTVAGVFGVEGSDAANIMKQAGMVDPSKAAAYSKSITNLGAAANISGVSVQELLQTSMAVNGSLNGSSTGSAGRNAVSHAVDLGSAVTLSGGSQQASEKVRKGALQNSQNGASSPYAQAANWAARGNDLKAKRMLEKGDLAALQAYAAKTDPNGLINTDDNMTEGASASVEKFTNKKIKADVKAQLASVGFTRKITQKDVNELADDGGELYGKLKSAGFSGNARDNIAAAFSGTGGLAREAQKIADGTSKTAGGMASQDLVTALKAVFSDPEMSRKLKEGLDKILTALGLVRSDNSGPSTAPGK